MPHSSTVSFLSYWRGLQTSPDKAPPRVLFDPGRLKSLVPQMMMISDDDAHHRFRLAGGFLVAIHGYELKGTSFLGLFRSPFVDTVQTALIMSRRRQQPVLLTLSAPWQSLEATALGEGPESPPESQNDTSSRDTVTIEACLCPMTDRDGKVDRFVGIYQTTSAPPKNPRGSLGRYTLVSSRLYEPQRSIKAAHLRLVAAEGKRIA